MRGRTVRGGLAVFVIVLIQAWTGRAHAALPEHHWSPVVHSIQEQHRTYNVTAEAYADGLLAVSITRPDGLALFDSTYPVIAADGVKRLKWTYHYPDGTSVSRSNELPSEIVPTIEAMAAAGMDVIRMLGSGLEPGSQNIRPGKIKTNDTWGCDLPEYADIECTNRGNCCDTHDVCYYVGNCSYWSWLGIQGPWCTACNAQVVLCITAGLASTEEPSICCSRGTCGQEFDPSDFEPADSGVNKDLTGMMYPSEGGAGTGWGFDVRGVVTTGNGTCRFPDGTVVPCG